MPKTQTELFNQITRQVKHMMTTEGTNWLKPWTSGATNALTGKRYRGINCLFLSSCTHWATYKQWQELGCQVRKGQKATTGLLFKPVTWSKETEGDTETGVYFMLKEFKVFSAAQVDGFEAPTSTKSEFERHAEADQFIANTGATIVTGSAAAYHPSRDFISMPAAASFIDIRDQHSTAVVLLNDVPRIGTLDRPRKPIGSLNVYTLRISRLCQGRTSS